MARVAMLSSSLSWLVLLSHIVSASIQFISPQPGAILKGGGSIGVEWIYSGESFLQQSSAAEFNMFLCAGGNGDDNNERLVSLIEHSDLTNQFSGSAYIEPDIGGLHQNAYFIEVVIDTPSGTLSSFSDRFSLSEMTGTFSQEIIQGLQSVSNTDGPPTQHNNIQRRATIGAYTIPYQDQTGPTRYAPMPQPPPSKISLKSAEPMFPTSSYKVAKTYLPTPTIETTVSASVTPTVDPIENTAAPAPQLDNDMEKFLNRWKD